MMSVDTRSADPLPDWDLALRTLEGPILSPATRDRRFPVKFTFGAHDAAGTHLDEFLLERVHGLSGRAPPPSGAPANRIEAAIYGGPLFSQYGHFLLESLARLWALREAPAALPIAWHSTQQRLTPWQHAIFAMVGIDPRRFVIVDRVTAFGRLLVPSPGFRIRLDAHRRQFEALAAVPPRPLNPAKMVWLSRSGLPAGKSRIDGEAALEAVLEAEGWTLFRPETADIPDQIDMLADARLIAGFEGSAFHSLVLLGCRSRVVIFQRGRRLNGNYDLIARGKGIPQENHFLGLTVDPANPRGFVLHARGMAKGLRILRAAAAAAPGSTPEPSPARSPG